ncbi:hypothetical protein BpHYR1_017099 [Brachionus plicatilis]|uniref:Uncharacterized protein n=1 Tax=Brachionus plicatilis TaxID=10195 RepID=A0A3M7RYD8_BRAPC|nr:hypothetical protein BpHYR1_017099 [Brachionus plicatilis]
MMHCRSHIDRERNELMNPVDLPRLLFTTNSLVVSTSTRFFNYYSSCRFFNNFLIQIKSHNLDTLMYSNLTKPRDGAPKICFAHFTNYHKKHNAFPSITEEASWVNN